MLKVHPSINEWKLTNNKYAWLCMGQLKVSSLKAFYLNLGFIRKRSGSFVYMYPFLHINIIFFFITKLNIFLYQILLWLCIHHAHPKSNTVIAAKLTSKYGARRPKKVVLLAERSAKDQLPRPHPSLNGVPLFKTRIWETI